MSGVLARIEGRVLRATTFRSSRAAGSAAGSGRGGRLSEKMRKRICCLRFRANRHQGCDARLVARAQASGLLESEHQEKSPIPLAATGAVRIPLAANTTGSHTGSQYHWQPLAYHWQPQHQEVLPLGLYATAAICSYTETIPGHPDPSPHAMATAGASRRCRATRIREAGSRSERVFGRLLSEWVRIGALRPGDSPTLRPTRGAPPIPPGLKRIVSAGGVAGAAKIRPLPAAEAQTGPCLGCFIYSP